MRRCIDWASPPGPAHPGRVEAHFARLRHAVGARQEADLFLVSNLRFCSGSPAGNGPNVGFGSESDFMIVSAVPQLAPQNRASKLAAVMSP
jgi:hypothetical protein